ncbi:MAG: amidase family protein [Chloroflexota bacterium]
MASQIERQTQTPDYNNKRPLNIGAVEADLADFTDADREAHDETLLDITIPELQAKFADGTLTSETLVKYYLRRILTFDVDGYSSVIELNPDALEIARQCDIERDTASSEQGSMYGIPVLLKDNIATGDKMHNTAGAVAMADSHADRDSFLAQKLREAGAIILGKCNLSEWANFMSFDSANGFSVLGGQTRNAFGMYDVGGSSSGSGSSVSANFATVTIGTETAGSLVSPASQNGVCTLKPSLGLLSRDRIIPISADQDTAGPMTRTMTDLAHFLNVLVGVDAHDAQTEKASPLAETDFTSYLDTDALKGARIAVVAREQDYKKGDGAFLDAAAGKLMTLGATIVRVPPLQMSMNFWNLYYPMHAGVNAYLKAIGDERTLSDIVAYNEADLANRAPFRQGLLHLSSIVPLDAVTLKAYERIQYHNKSAARHAMESIIRDHKVSAIVDINNYATYAYAVTGNPAVSVPTGFRDDGEPVSITFFGTYLQDPLLIAYGYAYEQATRIRKAPKLVLPSERKSEQ